MNNLQKAYEILFCHKNEMENFMDYYIFKKMKIEKDTFLDTEKDFLLFVEFCLNTAQMVKNENIKNGINYFKNHYNTIVKLIDANNIRVLQNIVYDSPGMGQKIGSMMLEFVYLYSNKRNEETAKQLYLPLDTHVIRLFKDWPNFF
jgi:hypothetical protein